MTLDSFAIQLLNGLVSGMRLFVPVAELESELRAFVKEKIAPYKYPRWIEFVNALPKTATGKIQRFKLRDL